MSMCVCVCVCVYGPAILFLAILYFSSKYNVSFLFYQHKMRFIYYFMFLKKIHSKLMMRHDDIIFNLYIIK